MAMRAPLMALAVVFTRAGSDRHKVTATSCPKRDTGTIIASLPGGTIHDRKAGLLVGDMGTRGRAFGTGRCSSRTSVRLSRQRLLAMPLQLPARMEIVCPFSRA